MILCGAEPFASTSEPRAKTTPLVRSWAKPGWCVMNRSRSWGLRALPVAAKGSSPGSSVSLATHTGSPRGASQEESWSRRPPRRVNVRPSCRRPHPSPKPWMTSECPSLSRRPSTHKALHLAEHSSTRAKQNGQTRNLFRSWLTQPSRSSQSWSKPSQSSKKQLTTETGDAQAGHGVTAMRKDTNLCCSSKRAAQTPLHAIYRVPRSADKQMQHVTALPLAVRQPGAPPCGSPSKGEESLAGPRPKAGRAQPGFGRCLTMAEPRSKLARATHWACRVNRIQLSLVWAWPSRGQVWSIPPWIWPNSVQNWSRTPRSARAGPLRSMCGVARWRSEVRSRGHWERLASKRPLGALGDVRCQRRRCSSPDSRAAPTLRTSGPFPRKPPIDLRRRPPGGPRNALLCRILARRPAMRDAANSTHR